MKLITVLIVPPLLTFVFVTAIGRYTRLERERCEARTDEIVTRWEETMQLAKACKDTLFACQKILEVESDPSTDARTKIRR